MSGYCYRWDHKYNQNDIYVGSTENDKVREGLHRSSCHTPNSEYNKPFYKHVRKYGTIDHWKMTIIYKGPNFKLFEKGYIKSSWLYNLNDRIPLQTKQEKKDHKQAYRVANRDIINKKANIYRVANRDKNKAWREANKDKIKEKALERYKLNKEKLAEKVKCDRCGAIVSRSGLSAHKKTKKCKSTQNIHLEISQLE